MLRIPEKTPCSSLQQILRQEIQAGSGICRERNSARVSNCGSGLHEGFHTSTRANLPREFFVFSRMRIGFRDDISQSAIDAQDCGDAEFRRQAHHWVYPYRNSQPVHQVLQIFKYSAWVEDHEVMIS